MSILSETPVELLGMLPACIIQPNAAYKQQPRQSHLLRETLSFSSYFTYEPSNSGVTFVRLQLLALREIDRQTSLFNF